MIRYNAKDASNALPAGKYPACIASSIETTSKKSGADMWKIGFTVFTPGGKEVGLFDYIVNPDALWKLKKIAKALGKGADFEAGKFDPSNYINANITLDLDIEDNADFGEQNKIKGYETPSGLTPARAATTTAPKTERNNGPHIEPIQEEDIPF